MIEHWDELPVDELRTRIAVLEQYARDCRRFTKAVEYTFAAFPPERRAAHLGLRAAELAKRGDALLPKEVASAD